MEVISDQHLLPRQDFAVAWEAIKIDQVVHARGVTKIINILFNIKSPPTEAVSRF
jgi:hypothetical protein